MKRNRRLASITLSMFGLCAALLARPEPLFADESGVSFWIPGFFGSLAATPSMPGWSWTTVYYHTDVSSGAGAAFQRGGRVDVGIAGTGDLGLFGPTYVFATPVLGGQLSATLLGVAGRSEGWAMGASSQCLFLSFEKGAPCGVTVRNPKGKNAEKVGNPG